MATNNATIMHRIFLDASNDYQQRVPDITTQGVAKTAQFLTDPLNRQYWNEFSNQLFNRVGYTYVRGQVYENTLKELVGPRLQYGTTVQEIVTGWVKAHSYTDDAETLLKVHRPKVEAWYHTKNREDKYPISYNEMELRQAFVEPYGLNRFISNVLRAPINSDEYDTYRLMLELIGIHDDNVPFYRHQTSGIPTTKEEADQWLVALRAYASRMKIPSMIYTRQEIVPVFAQPQDLVLITLPEVKAALDVIGLAAAFQMDKANYHYRVIEVDEFPIKNAYALLISKDAFVVQDTLYQPTTFYNPETLTNTHWLHHHSVNSMSVVPPAILFTTETSTVIPVVKVEPDTLSVKAEDATVAPGGVTQLNVSTTGIIKSTPEGHEEGVEIPQGAVFELSAKDTDGEPVQLNSRTYVDPRNRLHVQKSKITDGTVITVTASSVYRNPSGDTQTLTDTCEVTVQSE